MAVCAVTVTYADEMDLNIVIMRYEVVVLVVLLRKLVHAVDAHFGNDADVGFFK